MNYQDGLLHQTTLPQEQLIENKPVHFMDYANYIFRNGTNQEKREVTNILNRQLYIYNETVTSVPLI